MTNPEDQDGLFLSPTEPPADDTQRPTVDDSNEAMRRLRNPFDVHRPAGVGGGHDREAADQG